MLISLIAAMAKNRTIGADGSMPWVLPADLQRFKQLTMGHTLLMGRKTFESIGRPLPGRQTLILSREADYRVPGCQVFSDLQTALQSDAAQQSEELFISGGGEIYRQALPLTVKIYLTEIQREIGGDTFLPEIPQTDFRLLHSEAYSDSGEACVYKVLERIGCRRSALL